jgi:methyltransferase (TIGR00027 family)
MKTGKPSTTAEYMALFRAMETARPRATRLFEDQYAQRFLRPEWQLLVTAMRLPVVRDWITAWVDTRSHGAMSSGIARTRFIDDALKSALPDGIDQVVILGAGFDCRAHRIPGMDQVLVFEVDHPDTFTRRAACLRTTLPHRSQHTRSVPTDFDQGRLIEEMAGAGYDPARRTFFIWEGVTSYLTESAVDATLCWFGTAMAGSRAVFTYIHRQVIDHPDTFEGATELVRILENTGEPWKFGFRPEELPVYLAERGLELIEDLGAPEYGARYREQESTQSGRYEFHRIAIARVRGRECPKTGPASPSGVSPAPRGDMNV